MKYEDLHLNPRRALLEISELIGMPSVNKKTVDAAVRFAAFGNMQVLEKYDYFNTTVLRARNVEDGESYKVRRGQIGGYVDYLDAEDIAYIDEIVGSFDCPFVY